MYVSLLRGARFFEKAYFLMFAKDSGNIRDLGLCSYYWNSFLSDFATLFTITHVKNFFPVTELETLAFIWGVCHIFIISFTNTMSLYTNHTAVKAVLESENSTAKYGWGVTNVRIKQEERTRPRSFRQPSLASTCCRNWGRMKLRFPPLLLKASGETVLPNICHQCHTQFVWQTIRDKEWSTHLKEFRRLTRPVWDVRCCCWLSDVSTEANSLNYPSS